MSLTTRNAVIAAVLALPLVLGGCISLFPKTPPVQMYRFGDQTAAAAAPAAE